MKLNLKHLKEIVVEVATLKRPVTAGALASFVLVVAHPLGIKLTAEEVAGALVGIGTVAAAIEKVLGAK